jgi:hypothetical protein
MPKLSYQVLTEKAAQLYPEHLARSDDVVRRVADMTGLNHRTVYRAVTDRRMRLATRIAVRNALRELGLEIPPKLSVIP